jgi:transposase
MLNFRLVLSSEQREALLSHLKAAERRGDLAATKRFLAILALGENRPIQEAAPLLNLTGEAVRSWLRKYLLLGVSGLESKKSPGRPPNKLTKSQKQELTRLLDGGPAKLGLIGNCWRSPTVQHMIDQRFGVFYAVHSISQLLKSLGFSEQKARFVSGHLDPAAREKWLAEQWPAILAIAKRKNADLLFGDEASFPQWGTLSYTWARKGQQPTVATSGKRRGYKVFGLIDDFTGRFFSQCHEGRLDSARYAAYLTGILSKTRKRVILIQDGTKYHVSAAMQAFFAQQQDRLTVLQRPSYSPDYNPIEKLWKKVKEKGTHLHYFPTYDHLKNKVEEPLLLLRNAPEEVLSLFVQYNNLAQPIER